jgi:hypothetical protein
MLNLCRSLESFWVPTPGFGVIIRGFEFEGREFWGDLNAVRNYLGIKCKMKASQILYPGPIREN